MALALVSIPQTLSPVPCSAGAPTSHTLSGHCVHPSQQMDSWRQERVSLPCPLLPIQDPRGRVLAGQGHGETMALSAQSQPQPRRFMFSSPVGHTQRAAGGLPGRSFLGCSVMIQDHGGLGVALLGSLGPKPGPGTGPTPPTPTTLLQAGVRKLLSVSPQVTHLGQTWPWTAHANGCLFHTKKTCFSPSEFLSRNSLPRFPTCSPATAPQPAWPNCPGLRFGGPFPSPRAESTKPTRSISVNDTVTTLPMVVTSVS